MEFTFWKEKTAGVPRWAIGGLGLGVALGISVWKKNKASSKDSTDDTATSTSSGIELPGDVVQMYVRDPAGNLVEIDHHGVDRLPAELRSRLRALWDLHPQSEEQMRGRLFVRAPQPS